MVKKWYFHILLLLSLDAAAQERSGGDTSLPIEGQKTTGVSVSEKPLSMRRKRAIGTASVVGYSTSMILFSQAWYKNFPHSSFHTFNDGGEWLQMDKTGHAWAAYNTSRLTSGMWKWSGLSESSSVLLGTGSSLLFLLSIEYFDGRSAEWGWSWPDVLADVTGAGLFAGQELGWHTQKIQLKFSSHYATYKPYELEQRADVLFGKTFQERLLKDYNAQTYWLSFPLHAITHAQGLPKWLNLAVGYGASGMFGGYENLAQDKNGAIIFDGRNVKRFRQWYLSPDIDLTQIKTRSRLLRNVFTTLNALKIPFPALEFSNDHFRIKGLAF